MQDVFAVIMAGGSGTRFWPAGRKRVPKQLLAIAPGGTLIQQTLARVPRAIPAERTLIMTNVAHVAAIAEQVDLPRTQIIGEPEGRDTAACIALAAHIVEKRRPGAVMIVMAADHVIRPVEAFHRRLEEAVKAARETSALVTIGLVPTFPSEGFGYIETAETLAPNTVRVAAFREKPDRATAEKFLAAGNYLWNAGIFVWKASSVLAEIARQKPVLAAEVLEIAKTIDTPRFTATLAERYGRLEKISIDFAVLEKAPNRACVRADFEWDDVGSLEALARHNPNDEAGNVKLGDVHLSNAKRCIVDNKTSGLVALLGVEDLIVVRTGDAVLVARRDQAEKVKKLVEEIEKTGRTEVL